MINFANGFIKKGYGVASGKSKDKRFPNGTLSMQMPFFIHQGLDLKDFFPGTLNVLLPKHSYFLGTAKYFFPLVKWSLSLPAENFSFFTCTLQLVSQKEKYDSLIYWPHPSTKPEFFQDPSILEIIAPEIDNIRYGDEVKIFAEPGSVIFSPLLD